MKVELISYTPNPELVIATAAKLCYSNSSVSDLRKNLEDNSESIHRFLEMLVDIGHESPVEHVTFTFAIEGISRACSHQLVRHRIASYSQQSQRYVNMNQFDYVIPPVLAEDVHQEKAYREAMSLIQEMYDSFQNQLEEIHLRKLIADRKEPMKSITPEEDVELRRKAKKLANEDARYVLPNACETKIIVTMNIRSLMNFFRRRMCNRAQWEIRNLAWEMWKQCSECSPILFKNAGPDCMTKGKCGEGSMCCGKPYSAIS